jgi:glyoxylase-like metal-dependent hydrolase (beta-lactamase superfamily II)
VGCVGISRGGDTILIDPLLRTEHWPLLESALGGGGLHVILTVHWHTRSAAEIIARHPAARVWANSRDAAPIRRRTPVTDVFRAGDELPGGLGAHLARPRTEVVLWDAESAALVAGDVLLGAEGGGVRLCPASWLPSSTGIEELREALRALLELPVRMVLVSHGEPVLRGGGAALAAALEADQAADASDSAQSPGGSVNQPLRARPASS